MKKTKYNRRPAPDIRSAASSKPGAQVEDSRQHTVRRHLASLVALATLVVKKVAERFQGARSAEGFR